MNSQPHKNDTNNDKNDLIDDSWRIDASGYEQCPDYKDNRRKKLVENTHMAISIFTLIVAVFVAWFTCRIMKETGEQAKIAHMATYRQLRPYLAIDSPQVRPSRWPGDNRFAVNSFMKNSGQTPAYDVIGKIETMILNKGDTIPNPMNFPVDSIPFVIQPNTIYRTSYEDTSWNFNCGDFDSSKGTILIFNGIKLNPSKQVIFFLGKIQYRDNFGYNHWTSYCYHYTIANTTFSPYEKFNTTDRDSTSE